MEEPIAKNSAEDKVEVGVLSELESSDPYNRAGSRKLHSGVDESFMIKECIATNFFQTCMLIHSIASMHVPSTDSIKREIYEWFSCIYCYVYTSLLLLSLAVARCECAYYI